MRAFIKLNKGLMRMPIYWQPWLMLMAVANAIIPIFFIQRFEAQVVLGAFIASVILTTILTGLSGFTRLLGLGHILWFPLLIFLWLRLGQIPADDFFGVWIRALIAINAATLVIDTADVVRYIAGDRDETVKGL